MIDILVLCRLLLAGVFALAGVAKAMHPGATRRAFVDLGGSAAMAGVGAFLLPAAEIATAVALLFRATAWLASGFALLLLTLFTGVLLAQFRKRERPACPCFGFSRSRPVGRAEVVRNLALALLAGAVVVAGSGASGPDVGSWLAALPRVRIAGALVLLAAFGTIFRMAKRRQRAGTSPGQPRNTAETLPAPAAAAPERPRLEPPRPDDGLPVGSPVPSGSSGEARAAAEDARPRLLLFASERFPAGRALLAEAIAWERELAGAVQLMRVTDPELARRFRVRWNPAALLIDDRGRVATPVRHGAGAVRELVQAVRAASASGRFERERFAPRPEAELPAGERAIGIPAPVFQLPDARGALIRLDDLLGRGTALLFWNPACPHCRAITAELRRHEAQGSATSPRLVFVTAGPTKAARKAQANFASVSLFDPELAVAPRFGARGTPSAVLLDERGRIDSSLAVGRDDVLALLGISPVTAEEGR